MLIACRLLLAALPLAALGGGASPSSPLSPEARAALTALAEPELLALRAGDVADGSRLAEVERAELRSLEAPELYELRAGDLNLSDRDVQVIAITAVVVIALIIIL